MKKYLSNLEADARLPKILVPLSHPVASPDALDEDCGQVSVLELVQQPLSKPTADLCTRSKYMRQL
jgi:hypothetical protein